MKNKCPDCNVEVKGKSFLDKYNKNLYFCSSCNRAWEESAKYCKICLDVVTYCKCYEDVIDEIMGK